ncbi:MAG: AMP-binding protein, partial [Gammaproteobacteria bacterium]|nr:AMP-binding protein [Gammaproteobacteria bacterium]
MPSKLDVLKLKQTRGAILGLAKQVGVVNGLKAGVSTAYRSVVKGQNPGQAFFSSYWDVLGEREAVVCDGKRISFAEFKDRSFRLANALTTLGVNQGDRVAELLPNGPEWFEVMFATALTGRSMPMLNWHLKPHELPPCINKSNATALIIDAAFVEAVVSIKDQLTTVKHFIVVGDDVPEGMLSYNKIIAESDAFDPAGSLGMSATPYSGGTTGTPKLLNMDEMADILSDDSDDKRRGATKDEVSALALMQLGAFYWYKLGECKDPIGGNIRSMIPGPLYHAGVQVAVLPFFLGGTVVPLPRFTPEIFLKTIQDERINWTFVAPTMLERILDLPEEVLSRYNLSTMQSLICAAAPCPPDVKRGINALFRRQGAKNDIFMEYYGASETGLISVLVPE